MLQINACRAPSDDRRYMSLDNFGMVAGLHYLCSASRMHQSMLTRNNLQYPKNLQFKQLLADDDEDDVGASSAVGR